MRPLLPVIILLLALPFHGPAASPAGGSTVCPFPTSPCPVLSCYAGLALRHPAASQRAPYPMPNAQPAVDNKEKQVYYTVTRVVDGDTFWIDDGSPKGLKIRLIGVDAPEPRNNGKKPKGYFGTESSDYMKRLIGGKKVRLEYDAGRYDQYGRTLAYVYLEDGTFVNADLVKNGYATVMTTPPNVKYADTFVDLAARARKQKKGLWKESPQASSEQQR